LNWWNLKRLLIGQVSRQLIEVMREEYRNNFEARLHKSEAAKLAVAHYVNSMGMPCSLNPSLMAPKGADPELYKDGGDMYLHFRTEVKHRPSLNFTSAEDFPFDTIIVCAKESFDSQACQPKFYFVCNGPLTHAALIDVKQTREQWYEESVRDNERGYSYMAYSIPKEAARWIVL